MLNVIKIFFLTVLRQANFQLYVLWFPEIAILAYFEIILKYSKYIKKNSQLMLMSTVFTGLPSENCKNASYDVLFHHQLHKLIFFFFSNYLESFKEYFN